MIYPHEGRENSILDQLKRIPKPPDYHPFALSIAYWFEGQQKHMASYELARSDAEALTLATTRFVSRFKECNGYLLADIDVKEIPQALT